MRTVEEMQVSLNLASLKESKSDNVDQLTSALLVSHGVKHFSSHEWLTVVCLGFC